MFYYKSVLIGRIMGFSRPSVRPSVCPSVPHVILTQKQKTQKNRSRCKRFPGRAGVSGVSSFSSESQRLRLGLELGLCSCAPTAAIHAGTDRHIRSSDSLVTFQFCLKSHLLSTNLAREWLQIDTDLLSLLPVTSSQPHASASD